jgi:FkbM family methyltransferase
VEKLIRTCHKASAPIFSRILAPLVRRLVARNTMALPIDVNVGGMNLRCQFTDNYSEKKFVFTPWRYDAKEREMLKECLSGGGTFIDIGANVGLYTLTAAKAMAGQQGNIIAFEPNPLTMARLETNVSANSSWTDGKVLLLNHGVADQETSFTLNIDSNNLGASSISADKGQGNSDEAVTIEIPCRPLLTTLSELEITTITALKIDIEGAEDIALMPFLADAPGSLLPRLLIIENSEDRWASDVHSALKDRGYTESYRGKMNSVYRL